MRQLVDKNCNLLYYIDECIDDLLLNKTNKTEFVLSIINLFLFTIVGLSAPHYSRCLSPRRAEGIRPSLDQDVVHGVADAVLLAVAALLIVLALDSLLRERRRRLRFALGVDGVVDHRETSHARRRTFRFRHRRDKVCCECNIL